MPYKLNDDGSVTKMDFTNPPPEPPKSDNGCINIGCSFVSGVLATLWLASIILFGLESFNIGPTAWGWTKGGGIVGVAIVSIIVGVIYAYIFNEE